MAYVIDTNVLLRHLEPPHPLHKEAVDAVSKLLTNGEEIFVFPQIIAELWCVATRPVDKNGLGLSVEQVKLELEKIESLLQVKLDVPEIYYEWRKLVGVNKVLGAKVHDARIVAAMKVHGIENLLTFNTKDFKRYREINVLAPKESFAS